MLCEISGYHGDLLERSYTALYSKRL